MALEIEQPAIEPNGFDLGQSRLEITVERDIGVGLLRDQNL